MLQPDLNQYLAETEEVPCNVCGSDLTTVFAERERFGLPITSVQCNECGLLYLNERPTKQMYDQYNRADYRVVSFGTDEGSDSLFERQRTYTREVIAPFVRQHSASTINRALDIGCANGGIAAGLVDSFMGLEMHGLEPVVKHVQYAAQHVQMTVTQGLFEDYESSKQFDLVVFAQALNHTLDPRGNLKKIHSLLSEDGVLYISLQDTISALLNRPRERMPELNHPYMFSPETIRYMLEMADFEILGFRDPTLDARKLSVRDIPRLQFQRMLILARPRKKATGFSPSKPSATKIRERAEANIAFYERHRLAIDRWQQPTMWRKAYRYMIGT